MEICSKCGIQVEEEQIHFHLVRKGYCPSMFPFLKYQKLPLCTFCYERQIRAEKFEKALALIGLVIVIYLMLHWFVFIFAW